MVTEKLVFWEGTLLCGHWLKTDRNVLLCSASGRCLRWWVHLIACPRLAGSKTSVGIEPLRLSNDAQRCWGLNGVSPHGHVSMAPSSTGAGAHYAWHPGWLMNTISGPQCDLTHIYNHTHTLTHRVFPAVVHVRWVGVFQCTVPHHLKVLQCCQNWWGSNDFLYKGQPHWSTVHTLHILRLYNRARQKLWDIALVFPNF